MKKIYTLLFAMTLATFSFAQRSYTTVPFNESLDRSAGAIEATPTDTMGLDMFFQGSPTLYSATPGGYVVGVNGYGDMAKAQVYLLSDPTIVEEILFWFGAKEVTSGDPNSHVIAKVYDTDGTGTTTAGASQPGAPGTELSTVDVFLSDVDTSGAFTVAALTAPLFVDGDFAVGFDVSMVSAGDTVGLVSTEDGDAAQSELAWELWGDGSWHTMLAAWPLDIDFAIWPVVDNSSASIGADNFLNGMKLSQNQPNPASFETVISYELERNADEVALEIYDVTGKKVLVVEEGQKSAGLHEINVTAEKLSSGTYYYSLKVDDNRMTKKMMITK